MRKRMIGFITTTEIVFKNEIHESHIELLLEEIERELTESLEGKFNCKVIGGKGGFIYADENDSLYKDKLE